MTDSKIDHEPLVKCIKGQKVWRINLTTLLYSPAFALLETLGIQAVFAPGERVFSRIHCQCRAPRGCLGPAPLGQAVWANSVQKARLCLRHTHAMHKSLKHVKQARGHSVCFVVNN